MIAILTTQIIWIFKTNPVLVQGKILGIILIKVGLLACNQASNIHLGVKYSVILPLLFKDKILNREKMIMTKVL
jgi:hypothetical protein